jgi:hypothetical protein
MATTLRRAITSPEGDAITVSIGRTGQTTLKMASLARGELGTFTVRGLTHAEATSKSGSFWGRLWDKIKSVAKALRDAITFDVGGSTCRLNASGRAKGGRISEVTVGISCTN